MVNVAQITTEVPGERTLVVGRPTVRGKFLYVGNEKFWVRGVSYGTFFVGDDGEERLNPEMVARDFALMAANGFNVVRVHTGPPRWLLDMALENGLRVMVGLNWGEHMAFLDEPGKVEEIIARVRRWIRACAGHPAVFCYSIGNEIPASIVRWHGRQRVEKFIERLYRVAKEEDPYALVTYVNYPSTEYLRLPFLDFVAFNVYLESPRAFEDYLARIHSLSDDRPVLLSEIGLDSLRNGEGSQAATLDWQVRAALRLGCSGVIVFAWTDEWYHGQYPVEDWAFGLTTRDRTPKPALETDPGVRGVPVPLGDALAENLRGGVVAERRSDHSRHAEGSGAARLSGLRGDPGQRRIDRRDSGHRLGVSGPTHHDEEPGAKRRAQRRNPRRDRRDRRVHRRRCLSGNPLVAISGARAHGRQGRRSRRTEPPAPERWLEGGCRRERPGRPEPGLDFRHHRGAHPGVQHGVLERRARGGRRIRPEVPKRGRRRRRVLADPRPGRGHRVLAGRRRMAPPPPILPEVLEATGRLRKGRGPLGTQVAVPIQSDRAVELARTHLWKRRLRRSVVPRWTGLPGSLGHRTVPIALRVPRFAVVLGPRAGMVFDDRPPVGDVRLEHRLGRLDHLRAGVARRRRAAGRASLDRCAAGGVPRDAAGATSVARRGAAPPRGPPSPPPKGPPFRARPRGAR